MCSKYWLAFKSKFTMYCRCVRPGMRGTIINKLQYMGREYIVLSDCKGKTDGRRSKAGRIASHLCAHFPMKF